MNDNILDRPIADVQAQIEFWTSCLSILAEVQAMPLADGIKFTESELGGHTDGYGHIQAPTIVESPLGLMDQLQERYEREL